VPVTVLATAPVIVLATALVTALVTVLATALVIVPATAAVIVPATALVIVPATAPATAPVTVLATAPVTVQATARVTAAPIARYPPNKTAWGVLSPANPVSAQKNRTAGLAPAVLAIGRTWSPRHRRSGQARGRPSTRPGPRGTGRGLELTSRH